MKRFCYILISLLMPFTASATHIFGDVNNDETVNVTDVVSLVNHILGNGTLDNATYGDINGDGEVNVSDIVALTNYILGQYEHTLPDIEVTANGVTFTMKGVASGTFMMGADSSTDPNAFSNEAPIHQVTVGDYYIAETEVTQELWKAVMGSNPSSFTENDSLPVETVTWDDCQTFVATLSSLTGRSFRLPTEAEWEFAARGGNKSNGFYYSGSNSIQEVCWFGNNSGSTTHKVAEKLPNELGLYDMSGNVYEWCSDWYARYTADEAVNPTGPETGERRVRRGGSFDGWNIYCRSTRRLYAFPTHKDDYLGLRLAMDIEQ